MSRTPREIGTLAVVVLKARNLPNKRHIGKQDPYCCVTFNREKQRTRAIKRGGQHPEWDAEFRFKVFEDDEDERKPAKEGGTPPPPPPKKEDAKRKRSIKGGMIMTITCYADDPKEPELIGEAAVDLTEVLTTGETDEWFTFFHKDKYCGEVYLELTFYSNERPPEKKVQKKLVKSNKQYVGPGTFVPSEGSSNSLGTAGGRVSSLGKDNIPASLRASSSLAKLDLYIPPYEKNAASAALPGRRLVSGVDRLADEFGGLSVHNNGPRRRESFPPPRGHSPQPPSDGGNSYSTYQSQHSTGYGSESYSDRATYQNSYDRATTPVVPHSHHRNSFGEQTQTQYQSYIPTSQSQPHYDGATSAPSSYSPKRTTSDYDYGPNFPVPTASSGFSLVPPSSSNGYSVPATTGSNGYSNYPSQTPTPSGFLPPPSQTPAPVSYTTQQSQIPAPSVYAPTPAPMTSMTLQHAQQQLQSQSYQSYQQQYAPATPAPQQSYQQVQPQSVSPSTHPVPPQTYQQSPPSPMSKQYPQYHPSTPPAQLQSTMPHSYNPSPPVHGSRPLPFPQQTQGSPYHGLPTPPQGLGNPVPQGLPPTPSPTHVAQPPNVHTYAAIPPPPQPPVAQPQQLTQQQTYTTPQLNGHTIPPPPPLYPNTPSPHRGSIPPPPPLPTQPVYQQEPPSRPPLPQPPVQQQQQPIYTPPQHYQGSAPLPQPPIQGASQAVRMGQSVSLPSFQSIPPPPPLPVPPSMSSISTISPSASHPLPVPPVMQQQGQPPVQMQTVFANGYPAPGPLPRPPTQVYGGW